MDVIDFNKILERLDDEQKKSFVEMTRENQLLVILSIEMSNSNRLAKVEKKQIDMEADVRNYRMKREQREDNNNDDVMNTTQKIIKAIADAEAKKFNWGIYFRDRVLPNILSPAILILIYLIATQLKP